MLRRVFLTVLVLMFMVLTRHGCLAASPSFDVYAEACDSHLQHLQANLEHVYHLSHYEHFHWSQSDGQLIFSDHGKIKVVADVQFVGDISTISSTWLWAWANHTVLPKMKLGSIRVRNYGAKHGYGKLVKAEWDATQDDGWEMTAVAASILNAKGAYRSPGGNGFQFLVITDIHWAKPVHSIHRARQ